MAALVRRRKAQTTRWIVEHEDFIAAIKSLFAEVGVPDAEGNLGVQQFENGPFPCVTVLVPAVGGETPELRHLVVDVLGFRWPAGRMLGRLDSTRTETVTAILRRALRGHVESAENWLFYQEAPDRLRFEVLEETDVVTEDIGVAVPRA